MQLRDHPGLMLKWGASFWPPKWTTIRSDHNDHPCDEVGVLEEAMMNEDNNSIVFLCITFQGYRYMGSLLVDDPAFASLLYTALQACHGWSIKDIGNLYLAPPF